jgi:hypothetical protein
MYHNKHHIIYIVMDVQTQGLPHIYMCYIEPHIV